MQFLWLIQCNGYCMYKVIMQVASYLNVCFSDGHCRLLNVCLCPHNNKTLHKPYRLVSKEWLSGPDAGYCMLILGAGMFFDGLWQQSNAEYYTRLGDKENILFDQVHKLNYIIKAFDYPVETIRMVLLKFNVLVRNLKSEFKV